MNISYNWLKELIDIDLSPEKTAKALTRVGLAVEGIHSHKDDLVLDIDLTSNRPDCLSHLGVARELGVITDADLTADRLRRRDNTEGVSTDTVPYPIALAVEVVQIEAPNLCHRFTTRIIKGVKIGPSPQWLVDRLEALGERSINNVADITNYVMLELGQPMHAFDFDKLAENRIVVRTAKSGETVKTLDEVDRKLDETMLAICDANKPVAVAGIMGGFDSSITESTSNVLLEVAFFERENIRSTSRKLNLATEASYRFERGVDIENLARASNRATELIIELAGGEAGDLIDIYPTRTHRPVVNSESIAASVKRLTGLDVTKDGCIRTLNALGISSNDSGDEFTAPSWRHDIAIEEDLVEEITRHAGYENITTDLPPAYGAGEYQPTEQRKRLLRQALADQGFDEALSYSFIDTGHDGSVETVESLVDSELEEPLVTLNDSVIEGAVRMRPTLIPGLLAAVRHNLNHQRRDIKLFELGKVFSAKGKGEMPNELELFAAILSGGQLNEGRAMPARELDFYDAKGAVESVLESVGAPDAIFEAAAIRHLRNGQAASVIVDGKKVGSLGRLNEEISGHYKFKQPVYVAEIDLQAVLAAASAQAAYAALPKFPSIVRDVSFTVNRDVSYGSIEKAALAATVPFLISVDFVDIYESKGLDENTRSLTVRFAYRSEKRTLTEADIENGHVELLERIASSTGANLRN